MAKTAQRRIHVFSLGSAAFCMYSPQWATTIHVTSICWSREFTWGLIRTQRLAKTVESMYPVGLAVGSPAAGRDAASLTSGTSRSVMFWIRHLQVTSRRSKVLCDSLNPVWGTAWVIRPCPSSDEIHGWLLSTGINITDSCYPGGLSEFIH